MINRRELLAGAAAIAAASALPGTAMASDPHGGMSDERLKSYWVFLHMHRAQSHDTFDRILRRVDETAVRWNSWQVCLTNSLAPMERRFQREAPEVRASAARRGIDLPQVRDRRMRNGKLFSLYLAEFMNIAADETLKHQEEAQRQIVEQGGDGRAQAKLYQLQGRLALAAFMRGEAA